MAIRATGPIAELFSSSCGSGSGAPQNAVPLWKQLLDGAVSVFERGRLTSLQFPEVGSDVVASGIGSISTDHCLPHGLQTISTPELAVSQQPVIGGDEELRNRSSRRRVENRASAGRALRFTRRISPLPPDSIPQATEFSPELSEHARIRGLIRRMRANNRY